MRLRLHIDVWGVQCTCTCASKCSALRSHTFSHTAHFLFIIIPSINTRARLAPHIEREQRAHTTRSNCNNISDSVGPLLCNAPIVETLALVLRISPLSSDMVHVFRTHSNHLSKTRPGFDLQTNITRKARSIAYMHSYMHSCWIIIEWHRTGPIDLAHI